MKNIIILIDLTQKQIYKKKSPQIIQLDKKFIRGAFVKPQKLKGPRIL